MILVLFVAATLGAFVIRVLLRQLFVPVLLLFAIGYTIIWINGPPRHDAARVEEVRRER